MCVCVCVAFAIRYAFFSLAHRFILLIHPFDIYCINLLMGQASIRGIPARNELATKKFRDDRVSHCTHFNGVIILHSFFLSFLTLVRNLLICPYRVGDYLYAIKNACAQRLQATFPASVTRPLLLYFDNVGTLDPLWVLNTTTMTAR